jgi:hypothetical protein
MYPEDGPIIPKEEDSPAMKILDYALKNSD